MRLIQLAGGQLCAQTEGASRAATAAVTVPSSSSSASSSASTSSFPAASLASFFSSPQVVESAPTASASVLQKVVVAPAKNRGALKVLAEATGLLKGNGKRRGKGKGTGKRKGKNNGSSSEDEDADEGISVGVGATGCWVVTPKWVFDSLTDFQLKKRKDYAVQN